MLSRDTVYATYFYRGIRISTPHVSIGTSGARACMHNGAWGCSHAYHIIIDYKKILSWGGKHSDVASWLSITKKYESHADLWMRTDALVGFLIRCDGGLIFLWAEGAFASCTTHCHCGVAAPISIHVAHQNLYFYTRSNDMTFVDLHTQLANSSSANDEISLLS